MSISQPPVDKLEQIRQKYGKLTRVSSRGYVSCQLTNKTHDSSRIASHQTSFFDKFQSIHSFDEDERTLLKSIQQDVHQTIQRYKSRIQSIEVQKLERQSCREPKIERPSLKENVIQNKQRLTLQVERTSSRATSNGKNKLTTKVQKQPIKQTIASQSKIKGQQKQVNISNYSSNRTINQKQTPVPAQIKEISLNIQKKQQSRLKKT